MFSPEQIEYLRDYFQPITLEGSELPNIKDVFDYQNFVLNNSDDTKDLYVSVSGEWKLVASDIGG